MMRTMDERTARIVAEMETVADSEDAMGRLAKVLEGDMARLPLDRAVHLAVGQASVCWEDLRTAGAFDAERALVVAEALLERIREEYS